MTPAELAAVLAIAKVLLPLLPDAEQAIARAVLALFGGDLSANDLAAKILWLEQDSSFREAMARADAKG